MRRIFTIALIVFWGTTSFSRAGECSLGCKSHCMVPPPPACPDCSCPCDHRLFSCTLYSPEHAYKLIEELSCEDACKRMAAVKKLGCRLHADFCREPAVLDALLRALQCDPCWGVRQQAAWSLMHQHARVESAVLALYISSQLDPHYMVRTRAAESLDIITVGKRECYKELYKAADQLIAVLRAKGYKPGTDCCRITYNAVAVPGGIMLNTTVPTGPEKLPPPSGPEKLPLPTPKSPSRPTQSTAAMANQVPVLKP